MSRLPPCDHDECPRSHCKRVAHSLQRMVGRHIVHNCPGTEWKGGKIIKTVDRRDVVLMAIVGVYAMVRRPSCGPYVASVRELEVPSNEKLRDGATERRLSSQAT